MTTYVLMYVGVLFCNRICPQPRDPFSEPVQGEPPSLYHRVRFETANTKAFPFSRRMLCSSVQNLSFRTFRRRFAGSIRGVVVPLQLCFTTLRKYLTLPCREKQQCFFFSFSFFIEEKSSRQKTHETSLRFFLS